MLFLIKSNKQQQHVKLDYQVSICSLIPPATAISKTQDRADTSVWWKLPFSIFFIIYYVQGAIINKVCKPELWFLCSAHAIIVLYICIKFHENISNSFKIWSGHMCMVQMANFNIQRTITLKVGKQELLFMCSACHLMVLTFVSSFTKICQAVLKLWSGHENC